MTALPLSSADLLVGIKNVPLRIVSREWVEVPGAPDLLWIYLSNGRDYSIRWDAEKGLHRVFVRDACEVEDADTGLSTAVVTALGREVFERYATDQQGVSHDCGEPG